MKRIRLPGAVARGWAALLAAALLTLLGLRLLAGFDNKYTAKAQIAQDGATILPEEGVRFLVDGWELYPDALLSPADFAAGRVPARYMTWAGEYPSLAPFHPDGNPYGAATYRMRLRGEGTVSLYLQEPLCAARVFVDGRDLGGPGDVSQSGYRPLVRDTVYAFPVDGEAELIVQTANYAHYYGGLWYPPAVGDADAVARLVASRMIFYGFFCFAALALALFCASLWLGGGGRGDRAAYYFGLLCLSFALWVCYPFLRLWGVPLVRPLYALEDAAALCGLYCAVRIALLLFLPEGWGRTRAAACVLSLGMCGVTAAVPLLVLPLFPGFAVWYGPLVSWYKAACGVFLVWAALGGCGQGRPHALPVLTAVTVNGVCLLSGVLALGAFEPARGAWPEEYGAFAMALAFAWLMARRSRAMGAENLRLRAHLQEEVAEKTRHLDLLRAERDQLIAELGHDMKSPLTALSNMAQIIRLNDIMLDGDTREKMKGIEDNCNRLADRVRAIGELAGETAVSARMEPLSLNRFLAGFYRSNRPVVELTGPDFLMELTPLPCRVVADREKLSRALENLVFNAADFTPPEGRITLSLEREEGFAVIRVADTGCGIPEGELPKVFRRFYTTRAEEGGQGLGLAIARAVVLEHGGELGVTSAVGEGSTFTVRLPLVWETEL